MPITIFSINILKNFTPMKKLIISLCTCLFIATTTHAEKPIISKTDLTDIKILTEKEMSDYWSKFSQDPDIVALTKDLNEKKYKKLKIKEAAWGFEATTISENGKKEKAIFCCFDYYNPQSKNGGQGCSLIWRQVGKQIYKAYMIFPEGEKNMQKAFENSVEWFAKNGKVQKANSWGKCFVKCISTGNTVVDFEGFWGKVKVKTNCKNGCLGAVAICGGVTAIISVATGGVGLPAAAAIFFGCAGVACGTCFAACALGCTS